jgi:acetyltransferase-like isoleucine patch superfamily enzyme
MLQRLIGRPPLTPTEAYGAAVRARDLAATVLLRRSFHAFGKGSRLALPLYLSGPGSPRGFSVGAGTHIGPSCRLWLDEGATDTIGDGCYINGMTTQFAAERIEVGNAVLIASNVNILDHQHCTTDPTRPILEQGVDRVAHVRINDGAWLGTNAVIMPGVTIGRNAVVAANSVVTRHVPDYATVVGAPARVLGT